MGEENKSETLSKEEMLGALMSYKEKVDADVKRLLEGEVRKERKEFFRKVSQIQAKMKVAKSQYNSFGKYNFRNLDDILSAAKPLLEEAGLVLLLSDRVYVEGDWHYIEATAVLTDGINEVSTKALSREVQDRKNFDQSQITGACSSYARKMAASGLLGVSGAKDMDELNKGRDNNVRENVRAEVREQTKPDPIAVKRVELLKSINKQAKDLNVTSEVVRNIIKDKYKKRASAELTMEEIEDMNKNFRIYAAEQDAKPSVPEAK